MLSIIIGRFWYDFGHLRSSQQILFHTTCNTPLYEMCLSFDGVDREINLPTRCTPYLHSSLLKVRNCILTLLPFTFVEINFFFVGHVFFKGWVNFFYLIWCNYLSNTFLMSLAPLCFSHEGLGLLLSCHRILQSH
jgi:hypothetical protein